MNPEQQNFDPLCRLLKLKRHEQPPPRYFNDFSSQVVARIRAGEAGGRRETLADASWLSRFWSLFEAKPMLPGALGVGLCALLLFVATRSENTDNPSAAMFTGMPPIASSPTAIVAVGAEQSDRPALTMSSTNPVIQLGGSVFDLVPQPQLRLIGGGTPLIPFRGN